MVADRSLPRRLWSDTIKFTKWIVQYDDIEAHRVGVPMVGVNDYVRKHWHHPGKAALSYVDTLFPMRKWILSYNLTWGVGDLIAGITVALVLVPQSMSYANVAGLAPQFGLYSSFVGVVIYALFATSKDVTIGPVAVMSLQTQNVIEQVTNATNGAYSPQVIASALAFMCGIITLGVGLLRLGWIIEFIPAPAVSGFMTGSALTILVGQLPKLFGEKISNNEAMYKVAINFFKHLPDTRMDAALGIPALVFLYSLRSLCNWIARRYPRYAKAAFFTSVIRSALVIIVLTVASRIWLGSYPHGEYPISLILDVPRGFKNMGQPVLPNELMSKLGSQLPASVIVLLLEHIAIAKSFGRVNSYKINPNQELVAIGVTNLVGPCFGGYAATGSFSRSAIKSKSGVRSPIAGWVTAIAVLIAIYALPGVFYWIPNAGLAAVIIHAVGDLIAWPPQLYKFWMMNPIELFIWVAAVLVTVFTSVDYGVYTSVAASAAFLLIRIAHPRGHFLGVVHVQHTDHNSPMGIQAREVFVPMDTQDGMRDPSIHILPPPPGIFIYRVEESFTYPNASRMADIITDKIKRETRPTQASANIKPGDRPWNDPGPPNTYFLKAWRKITFYNRRHKTHYTVDDQIAKEAELRRNDARPLLHALVLDFGSVGNIDSTSVQTLVDLRNAVERYSGRTVQFHFAHILSPWIRRGLLAGGFGTGALRRHITEIAGVVPPRDTRTVIGEQRHLPALAQAPAAVPESTPLADTQYDLPPTSADTEAQSAHGRPRTSSFDDDLKNLDAVYDCSHVEKDRDTSHGQIAVPIMWNNELTPFFHLDLQAAVAAAIESLPQHDSA
ncbi:hypothetical protein MVES1_001690 [Malassezia vespertilionis]|uniref:STAS domain-containing protein n=1 Tax=Malassezia vespertilionis TaxID=2020962 RepID=A0A2N1JDG9_9BASI|nr:uncharacterized protein MVES1_001690 [Malassezia vespertilionis]PKI84595.1 hypothetical protein MVES_001591 [Malassezia vespertilionis]WFD06345.1 hypothetical protein MVES1_001690 [Malassezia vespertilionis]